MLFLKAQFTSFITDDNKLDSLFKKERKQTLEKLKFIVRSGQEKGSIRKDMDPENIVFALVSIYIGLITTWFFDLEEFNINEIAEDYLDILMNGILK